MIDSETYKYINFIGEGMYGKVYLVKGTKTKKYFAMKTIDINNLKENQRKECYFESKILQKLDHIHSKKANLYIKYSNRICR